MGRVTLWRVLAPIAILVLGMGLFAACTGDDEDDDGDDDVRPITSTPTAIVGMPEDVREETVIIENGSFDTGSIDAIVEEPVMLRMVNRDDQDYTFEADQLITETEIPAASEMFVNFNAPNDGEYEAFLYGPDGEEVTSIFINVTGPGGT